MYDYTSMIGLLMQKHGLLDRGWTHGLCKRRKPFSRAGVCSTVKKRIDLQPTFIELNDPELVHSTILHEIAHALTPKHGHNKFWKRKAIEVGHSGKRCYSDSVKRQ